MNLNLKKATLVVTMSTVMMGVAPLTVAAETTGSMPTAPAKTGKVVRGKVSDSQSADWCDHYGEGHKQWYSYRFRW